METLFINSSSWLGSLPFIHFPPPSRNYLQKKEWRKGFSCQLQTSSQWHINQKCGEKIDSKLSGWEFMDEIFANFISLQKLCNLWARKKELLSNSAHTKGPTFSICDNLLQRFTEHARERHEQRTPINVINSEAGRGTFFNYDGRTKELWDMHLLGFSPPLDPVRFRSPSTAC